MNHQVSRRFLQITFLRMPADIGGFWEVLFECLKEQEMLPKMFRLSQIAGHASSQQSEEDLRVLPSEIAETISTRKLNAFSLNTGYTSTSVTYRLHQGSFHCGVEVYDKALEAWRIFTERISSHCETVGSWIPVSLYQSWQGSLSPDDYKYGSYGPLPSGFSSTLLRFALDKSASPA